MDFSSFINLDKYLKQQMELQKDRRKLAVKNGSGHKDNRFADSNDEEDEPNSSRKSGKQRRRIVVNESDEDHESVNYETLKKTKKKKQKHKIKETEKSSPLDYKVLFPKKRKRKEKVGSGVSDDPWVARKKPGKTAAETNSMYINPSDDSDYVPSDAQSSGMLIHSLYLFDNCLINFIIHFIAFIMA